MKSLPSAIALLTFTGLCALINGACGGDDAAATSGAPKDLAFRAEAAPLPGFSYDTGLQPKSGPAQISMKLAAGGAIVVANEATVASGTIAAKPQAGKLKLDVHVKLVGTLKVDAGRVKYDGDLPGLANVDIPIGGEVPFDGFLVDGAPASVQASLPETKLPDIPLGTVPGHLAITVTSASKLTTAFKGACVEVHGGKASYSGVATTSGTLVLKSQIVLDLPLIDPVELPSMTIPIPDTVATLTSTPVDAAGVGDAKVGTCAGGGASPDPTNAPPGSVDGGAPNEGGGPLTCSAQPTGATCLNCCADTHPAGVNRYTLLVESCLCQPTACGAACGAECGYEDGGAPGEVGATCLACAQSVSGLGCYAQTDTSTECLDDPDCKAYVECTHQSGCLTKK